MDHKIYFPPRSDYGVYGTRRYPKGDSRPQSAIAAHAIENRSPVPITLRFTVANVGVHNGVERWTYTVPNRRRAVFQALEVDINRVSAGAANPINYAGIFLLRYGAPQDGESEVVRASSNNDVITDGKLVTPGGAQLDLFEGDRLRALTTVGSGTWNLLANAHGIEYNAQEQVIGHLLDATGGAENGYGGGSPPSLFSLKKPTYSGTSSGGVVIRSETALNPAEWQSIGGGYYQRI